MSTEDEGQQLLYVIFLSELPFCFVTIWKPHGITKQYCSRSNDHSNHVRLEAHLSLNHSPDYSLIIWVQGKFVVSILT